MKKFRVSWVTEVQAATPEEAVLAALLVQATEPASSFIVQEITPPTAEELALFFALMAGQGNNAARIEPARIEE
jgi:hypothetical protein